MFTIISDLRLFRLPLVKAREYMDIHYPNHPHRMSYGEAMELEAATKGEPYTAEVMTGVARDSDSTDIVCSDQTITLPYKKETLARHSLLIRYFIEDYPDETITVNHRSSDMIDWTNGVFGVRGVRLNSSLRRTMQTLTPPSDIYYLMFDLTGVDSSFIISILNGLTVEERRDLLERHQVLLTEDNMVDGEHSRGMRPLPNRGEGLMIGYSVLTVREYLRDHIVPEIQDECPSYVYYDMVNYYKSEVFEPNNESFLLTHTFDDDSGLLLKKSDRNFLISEIMNEMGFVKWEDCCVIFAMLGVRDPLLKNEHIDRMGPYQIVLEADSVYRREWYEVKGDLEEKSPIPMSELDRLISPYLVSPRE